MYALAMNEKHRSKDVGYPYLISFNNKIDWDKKNQIIKQFNYQTFKNDKRTIDCKNEENCINIVKQLIKNKIINIDLGGYQICYRWFPYKDLAVYFDLSKSYLISCKIVYDNVQRYGNSMKVISYFHSRTEKRNKIYRENLQANLIATYPKKYTCND